MGRRGNSRRVNATGRNNTSRFARLDHRILYSNGYRALSPNDRSLLVELVSLDNGENNGSLYLSVRDAADRMGVADLSAASRSFRSLQELGFIQMVEDASFNVKASERSRARCWRLTWLPGPGRIGPTWDFMQKEPLPKTRERKRMERGLRALKAYRRARDSGRLPVLDSDTMSSLRVDPPPEPVLDSNTPNDENGVFQPNSIVRDSATHIATTMGSGAPTYPIGWWEPDWTWSIANLAVASIISEADGVCARRSG